MRRLPCGCGGGELETARGTRAWTSLRGMRVSAYSNEGSQAVAFGSASALWTKRPSPCRGARVIRIFSNPAAPGRTGFLRRLARGVAGDGVTVNSWLPGLHETGRIAALHGSGADLAAGVPAGFIGDPADFGRIGAFVCSEHARYLTGTAIQVDGGAYGALL